MELKVLNLSSNSIKGIVIQGATSLASLKNLETLDLGYNKLNKSIVPSICAFPSLKNLILKQNRLVGSFSLIEDCKSLEMLDLSMNELRGPVSIQEMATLSSLKVLKLQHNHLNGKVPFEGLSTPINLELLDLSFNNFTGNVPPNTEALASLKALSLSSNGLNGSLPAQSFFIFEKIEELDLSGNGFEGLLPECLNKLKSLRLLDLSGNHFSGSFPSSLVTSLPSLEYLDLSSNLFEGSFSFSLYANHSRLEVFQLVRVNNNFRIENDYQGWLPNFQLNILVLSNCNLNRIPEFLFHQNTLRIVDLSHNKLTGNFPIWLLENNPKLETLNLRNNSFHGHFHLPPTSNFSLLSVDISENSLNGQLDRHIGKIFPQLGYFNLSRNGFEGPLPTSIGDMKTLWFLDVSFNKFSGLVPTEMVSGCINLGVLKMSNNNFYGDMFSSDYFNLTQLVVLQLDNNHFTLSHSYKKKIVFPNLYLLDMSNNQMSGKIPNWIGNTSNLYSVSLQNNFLIGRITCETISKAYVDISHNLLGGPLPSCVNPNSIFLFLQGNKFRGSIPRGFQTSSKLLVLDIRDNSLSGSITDIIGSLSHLRFLLLGGNHFNGVLPNQLCQLENVAMVDFSNNYFSGSIPFCFYNISFQESEDAGFVPLLDCYIVSRLNSPYVYSSLLNRDFGVQGSYDKTEPVFVIQFFTKNLPIPYKGSIFGLMSGLDLSCNKLTGEIPVELGRLSWIRSLNISRNFLTGTIPRSFSNLTEIESLDLSHNFLSGEIPAELAGLTSLEVFSVAYNNLSGRIPSAKQFGTFEKSSYEGNPFLCGLPLDEKCTSLVESPLSPATSPRNGSGGKWHEVDSVAFFSSFAVSYVMFFLAVITIIYLNPRW